MLTNWKHTRILGLADDSLFSSIIQIFGGSNSCRPLKSTKNTDSLKCFKNSGRTLLTKDLNILNKKLLIVTSTNKRIFVQDQPSQVTYACQKDPQLQPITRTRLQFYQRCYHLMLAFEKVTVNLYFNLFFHFLQVK